MSARIERPNVGRLLSTLVRRNLSASATGTAAALTLLFLFFSLASYLFSTFGQTNRDAMMAISPEFLIAFFGGGLGGLKAVDLWLITLYAHPLLIVVLVAAVVAPLVRDVCGEIDRGTIDLLLGCPVPRWVLPTSVWLSAQITLAAIALVLWCAAYAGAAILGTDSAEGSALFEALPRYRPVLVQYWLLGQSVVALGIWFSARSSLSSRAMGKTVGLVIASYFLNLLAGLWSVIEPLRWLSIFHYYQPQPILVGQSQALEQLILAIFSLVLVVGAVTWFERRDIDGP